MKKKNLVILLLLPFIISLLCIITINTTYQMVDVDISFIDWAYSDVEPFKLEDNASYELNAVGVNQKHYAVSGGNELVWTVQNQDPAAEEPCAEIVVENGVYKLKPLAEGTVIVTCSNTKGNVTRKMTAVIYTKGAILVQPKIGSSQSNVDPTVYYGQYDLKNGAKVPASFEMSITEIPSSGTSTLLVKESSENIRVDIDKGTVDVLGTGAAYFTVASSLEIAKPQTYSFEIVENGVNVYTYDDLLNCTNRSANGEIVVLRKSFESLENAYVADGEDSYRNELKYNNVECFGNYDFKNGKYTFANEIYSFPTTYNSEFIKQWNAFADNNSGYNKISDRINVGLRVQKDLYGNGYTINLHNLTYPYGYREDVGTDGQTVYFPNLTSDNLFRGPLPFYTLGDPNQLYDNDLYSGPLVTAYGQDNIGMYVNGDNITVNDLVIKNCDFGDRFANMDTVGTVMEVSGNGVTVKNSRLSNGRNVLRSFSSMDLTVKNCMLSYSRTFLFTTGANEYEKVNGNARQSFTYLDGTTNTHTLAEYIAAGAQGDTYLNNYLQQTFSTTAQKNAMKETMLSIQSALNNVGDVKTQYKGSTVIEDTYFYKSGIAAICAETLFNGPFLYNNAPSFVTQVFDMFSSLNLAPYIASNVSGVSYPVTVDVKGNTRFYDYKTADQMELDGLIDENISTFLENAGLDMTISIDDFFPLKSYVKNRADLLGGTVENSFSVPVAYYGGGANYTKITFDGIENKNNYSNEFDVDLLSTYLNRQGGSGLDSIGNILVKTVTTATGYEPFKFRIVTDGYLYGETPRVDDLIANAKGVTVQ